MNRHLLLAGAAGFALTAASAAQAQSVDYGSLQQLFNEPVTTSATGSPQRSTEAPADMEIISADDIRRSGETTIPGILQRTAGMDVLNQSVEQSDLNVRGYNQSASPRLLVLINGRQVYQDTYGYTVWSTLPVQLSEIRQIEVVKGPNAALFGFNAVSGVINIITFNPKYDNTNVGSVRVGSGDERQVSLVSTFKIGSAISVRLSGGGQYQKEWKATGALAPQSNYVNPVDAESNLDIVAQLAPKTELRLEGSWSNVQQNALQANNYTVEKMVSTSQKATITSDTGLGLVQGQLYQNQLIAKYGTAQARSYPNNVTTVASLQDLFKIGANNTFRIDGEYRQNRLNTVTATGGEVSYSVWSGSAMWNWTVLPQFTTTAAVRVDHLQLHRTGPFPADFPLASNAYWNSSSFTQPSLNLTAAWRPTENDAVRLSYSRGIQAPSLIELGALQAAVGPSNFLGNPRLNPTIVTNYELAYDRQFSLAKIGARLFLQDWKQLPGVIDFFSAPDIAPTSTSGSGHTFENVSDSQEKGVEVTAAGPLPLGVKWRGNYSYTDVKDSVYSGYSAVNRNVAFQSTTPKSRANLGLDWEKGPWETDANVHYVSDFQLYSIGSGNLVPVGAYYSLSARVGYTFHTVTLALSGQNLLNERQRQTTGLEAERRVQFTLSKAW